MKAAGNPWMKFYPSDWRADPALRSCSIAARGLWIEMLCIMHEAEPYGSLLIKSQRIDKKRLASLCGIPEKECVVLMLELEGFGVFERDLDGTIYSRRMRRDAAKAEEGRKQVAKRWDKNEEPDRSPNRSPKPEIAEEPNTQKPEAIFQKSEKRDTREVALSFSECRSELEIFWASWPNRVGKPAALKALRSALKRATLTDILAGVENYIRDKPPDRPWLNPSTFLNQNRWEDQPAQVQNGKISNVIQATDNLVSILEGFDRGSSETYAIRGPESPTNVRLLSQGRRE